MAPPPPRPTLFPYTTLFRSLFRRNKYLHRYAETVIPRAERIMQRHGAATDRKSTRLNSSHEWISYAVFCLKKKKSLIDVRPPECGSVGQEVQTQEHRAPVHP